MTLTEILRELQKMLHDSEYTIEDKYHIVMAHNELMEVFNHDKEAK